MNLQPDFSCSDTFNGTYDNKCYANCTGKYPTGQLKPLSGFKIFFSEYLFQESTFSESIVTKYQLVCKKDHLGPG